MPAQGQPSSSEQIKAHPPTWLASLLARARPRHVASAHSHDSAEFYARLFNPSTRLDQLRASAPVRFIKRLLCALRAQKAPCCLLRLLDSSLHMTLRFPVLAESIFLRCLHCLQTSFTRCARPPRLSATLLFSLLSSYHQLNLLSHFPTRRSACVSEPDGSRFRMKTPGLLMPCDGAVRKEGLLFEGCMVCHAFVTTQPHCGQKDATFRKAVQSNKI